MKNFARVECILELVRTTAPTWGVASRHLRAWKRVCKCRAQVAHSSRRHFPHPRERPWLGTLARAEGRLT